MKPQKKQAGFTLVELMMASTLGLILLIATLGILYDSGTIADVLRTRASLNAAARESFDLLLDGGLSDTDQISGLRGLSTSTVPSPASLQIPNGNRVRLLNGSATVALEGPRSTPATISCAATGDPIPACTGAGPLNVEGYLGGPPVLNTTRSVQAGLENRTVELELILFNPYLLGRDDITTQQATEVYRTIFTLNVD